MRNDSIRQTAVKNDRLDWTDKEWSAHLGVREKEMPYIRKRVESEYLAYIAQARDDQKYYFMMERRHDAPSGFERWIPMLSSNKGFASRELAAEHANNEIIPLLELNEFHAGVLPAKCLQLLRVHAK
ncbi:MAG: hypothetical protein LBL21_03845 [Rickettsiales bacterium]|jgi:hypothetical protein|nr:hypothetical protein [Rickettsiales bacterium]